MILHNHASVDFVITTGQRVAQMIVCRHVELDPVESSSASDGRLTERMGRGFGSTGTHEIRISKDLTNA